MSKPLDYLGNEITVGDTVIYVGAGYTTFEQQVVTKVSPKTVTLGDKSRWGSYTRRPFTSVIILKQGGAK